MEFCLSPLVVVLNGNYTALSPSVSMDERSQIATLAVELMVLFSACKKRRLFFISTNDHWNLLDAVNNAFHYP